MLFALRWPKRKPKAQPASEPPTRETNARAKARKLLIALTRYGREQASTAPPDAPETSPAPVAADPSTVSTEWARFLLESFATQRLADNKAIWDIGSIFVPLSLAPFGVLVFKDNSNPNVLTVLVCALSSLALYALWVSYANRMRTFQEHSAFRQHAVLDALTELGSDCHVFGKHWPSDMKESSRRIRSVRALGIVFLVVIWSVLLASPALDREVRGRVRAEGWSTYLNAPITLRVPVSRKPASVPLANERSSSRDAGATP